MRSVDGKAVGFDVETMVLEEVSRLSSTSHISTLTVSCILPTFVLDAADIAENMFPLGNVRVKQVATVGTKQEAPDCCHGQNVSSRAVSER